TSSESTSSPTISLETLSAVTSMSSITETLFILTGTGGPPEGNGREGQEFCAFERAHGPHFLARPLYIRIPFPGQWRTTRARDILRGGISGKNRPGRNTPWGGAVGDHAPRGVGW